MNDDKSEIASLQTENKNLKKRIGELEKHSHESNLESRKEKETEDKIKLLGEIAQQTSYSVIITDLNFKITWVNKAFKQLYGYSSKEVIGRTPDFLNVETNSEEIQNEIYNAVSNGESYKTILLNLRKDGSTFTCNIEVFPLLDKSKNIVAYSSHTIDITQIKKTEEMLEESEEKYRALYNNVPLSYQSLNADGCIIDINPAWLRTLGYDREEVIGKKFADFLHQDWKPHFEKNFPEFKNHGYISDVHFRIRHKDGSYLDISFEGSIGYYPDDRVKQTYSVFQDITEQKKVELELINSEDRYRKLFDNHGAVKLIIDPENGNIVEANKAASKFYGWSVDDLTSMNISQINTLPPEKIQEEMNSARSNREQYFEFKHRRADGLIYDVAVYSSSLIIEDKTFLHSIIHDITKQKKVEMDLISSKKRYQELFEESPVALWEEDFSEIKIYFDELRIGGIKDFRKYFEENPNELNKCVQKIKVEDVNKAALEMHKAKNKEELLGSLEKTFTHKSFDVFKEELLALAEGRKHFESQAEVKTLTGEVKNTYLRCYSGGAGEKGEFKKVFLAISDITNLIKVEQELKESKLKYKLLADFTYDWEYWVGPSGEYIYLSPAVERITGFTVKEFMLNPDLLFTIVREDFKEEVLDHYKNEENFDYPLYSSEFPIITKSGEEKWIAHVCTPVFDQSGSFVGRRGNNRDITLRIIAQKKLRKSERLLSETQKISKIGGWDYRISDGQIIWTDETYNIYGLPKKSVKTAEDSFKYYHKDDIPIITKAFKKCVKNGTPYKLELRFRNTKKKEMWVQTSGKAIFIEGKITKIIGNIIDITKRKSAEEKLKISEERFKQVVESTGEWIWEVDKDGLYTFVSKVSENLLGYFPDEILGKKYFYDFFKPEIREDLKKEALKIFSKKESFKNFENSNVHRDGRIVILETSGTMLLDKEGNFLGYRGVDKDITKRKEAEERLKSKNNELQVFNNLMVGRENKMIDLKNEINDLLVKQGEAPKYDTPK